MRPRPISYQGDTHRKACSEPFDGLASHLWMEGTTGWVDVTQGRKKPGMGESDQLPGFHSVTLGFRFIKERKYTVGKMQSRSPSRILVDVEETEDEAP